MRTPAFVVALVALPGPGFAAGGLAGTVTTDAKPTGKPLPVTKDNAHCGATVADETLLVKDGRLANVVVWVEGGPAAKVEPVEGATLDNRMCAFVPHVQAVTKGTRLPIGNRDPMLHNVHSYGKGDRTLFNLAMPLEGQVVKQRLKKTGLVRVACDVHEWMSAWVHVFDHPWYAVSAVDGTWRIDGVPPGSYVLHLWHEKLGERTVNVTVAEGATAAVDEKL